MPIGRQQTIFSRNGIVIAPPASVHKDLVNGLYKQPLQVNESHIHHIYLGTSRTTTSSAVFRAVVSGQRSFSLFVLLRLLLVSTTQ